MTTSAVHLDGVGKDYSGFALRDIDIDLPRGQVLGLVGPNGAGKSTTLRIVMGLVHHDRGEVRLLGHAMPAAQVAAKREVGFASEDMRLYRHATLGWHMGFVAAAYPRWDHDYASALLTRFDLDPGRRIRQLSRGQQVKATLLLVLARRPGLVILDEPTAGLDPVARHDILDELMEVVADEERSVIFSSQNTRDVEQICDWITFIDRGQIVASGDKESFLESWRRLRLELPEGGALPEIPGLVDRQDGGRLVAVTTRRFDPAVPRALEAAGARVRAVETLTLEEIFVASVRGNGPDAVARRAS